MLSFLQEWNRSPRSKRVLDVVGAGAGLVVLSPLLLFLTLLVSFRLSRRPFFLQVRAGLNGRPFTLVKFRTMTEERDGSGQLLPDDRRLTAFGSWLRSTSLDELPELWNVLRGEMSLVGPRPLFTEYIGRYSQEQRRRLEAKPGLTGWAQINGRNSVSWEERFRHDVWYVHHQSLALDLRIILKTIPAALGRQGINASENITMEVFQGSKLPS